MACKETEILMWWNTQSNKSNPWICKVAVKHMMKWSERLRSAWSCPKTSCYPPLYFVLRLWDETYQPQSYLTRHDPEVVCSSFLDSGTISAPGTVQRQWILKGAAQVQASSDTPGTWKGHRGISHLCWDHTFFSTPLNIWGTSLAA